MLKIDTKLYKVADFIYKIVLLNILLIMGSLGVVTIGASISATLFMWTKIFKGEDSHIIKDFISKYKDNLKQSSIITIGFIIIFMLLTYRIENKMMLYLNYFLKVHLVVTTLLSLYVISKYNMKLKEILIFSFIRVNRNMYILIPFLIIPYIHMFIVKYVVFLFILTGGSLTLLMAAAIFYPLLSEDNEIVRG
ncbi:MAG: DUF624 domain-containing protein [Fusobacteriota bacterium]